MRADLDIPDGLAARVVHHRPDPGREDGVTWLRRLPGLVAEVLEEWELEPDGPSRHGQAALVLPVRRGDGGRAVLKVTWPHDEAATEHLALRAWTGRRSVRLLAADPARWCLLLERLDAGRDLDTVDVWTSCAVVGRLLRDLDTPALPRVGRLSDHLTALAEDSSRALTTEGAGGLPRRYLEQARSLARQLAAAPEGDTRLLHTDLHGQNVLHRLPDDTETGVDGGGWVAIDPKPLNGQPAFGVAPLLWNRWPEAVGSGDVRGHLRRRLAVTCEAGGLDEELATAYSTLRMVRNALWAVQAPGPHTREEVTTALTVLKALEPA